MKITIKISIEIKFKLVYNIGIWYILGKLIEGIGFIGREMHAQHFAAMSKNVLKLDQLFQTFFWRHPT